MTIENQKTISEDLGDYWRRLSRGVRSSVGSFMTALPYLMNIRSGELKKEVTEQYPDRVSARVADELPPRSRGILVNDIDKCTGCKDCVDVCPSHCISVETELGPSPNKAWVSVFDIDFARCTFCGLCVEACQPTSLKHTREYELAADVSSKLVGSYGQGRVAPEQRTKWAEIRKRKEAEDAL